MEVLSILSFVLSVRVSIKGGFTVVLQLLVLYVCIHVVLVVFIFSQCYKKEEQSLQCPVCSNSFNELASSLPFSHSSQSYLICRISGEPMNEYNPPMLLPNGNVYGEQV